jgi:hypothetical protein
MAWRRARSKSAPALIWRSLAAIGFVFEALGSGGLEGVQGAAEFAVEGRGVASHAVEGSEFGAVLDGSGEQGSEGFGFEALGAREATGGCRDVADELGFGWALGVVLIEEGANWAGSSPARRTRSPVSP